MKLHSSAFGLICAEVNHIKQRVYKCMTLQAYAPSVIQKAHALQFITSAPVTMKGSFRVTTTRHTVLSTSREQRESKLVEPKTLTWLSHANQMR